MPPATTTTSSAVTAKPASTAEATMPRTESTRIATAAIVTTTIVSTTRSMTIVPRIVERLRPGAVAEVVARTSSPSRAGRTLFARYPTSSEESTTPNGTAATGREQHPPADGPQEDVADDEDHQQGDPARVRALEHLPGRGHVHRPDDQRQGDDRDGDAQRRPPQAPAEAHAQAVPGSLAETRGRSFADRRSPVRCRR